MSRVTLYAYLPADFAGTLPADPLAAAQTTVSLSVTLARGASPVPLMTEAGVLAAPARIGGQDIEAGTPLGVDWTLLDAVRGLRLTGYRMGDAPAPIALITALLPLRPGQTLDLSLPIFDAGGGGTFFGGFGAGTRILTQSGKRPIDEIAVGDPIWTEALGFQPVLWHGVQTVPARGVAAPIRLRRGGLGLTDDLLISGGQCVRRDAASGPVLIPAAALVAAGLATREFGAKITWHQILLPDHAVVFAQGLGCESLWPPTLGPASWPHDWPKGYRPPDHPALPRLSLAQAEALVA